MIQHPAYRPDISSYGLDDELVLFDPSTARSFVLNPTGAEIWELCDGAHAIAEIVDAVTRRYNVIRAQARQDVGELLTHLESNGLLEPGASGPRAEGEPRTPA